MHLTHISHGPHPLRMESHVDAGSLLRLVGAFLECAAPGLVHGIHKDCMVHFDTQSTGYQRPVFKADRQDL